MSSTSRFDFNCPVEQVGVLNPHECGVKKPLGWSHTGLTENTQNFNLQYDLLDNLVPVYVTLNQTVRKLIRFDFSNIVLNGSTKVDIYIKHFVSGNTITVDQISITGTSSFSEFVNFTLDAVVQDNIKIFFDVVVNGGSSGSMDVQIICNALPEIGRAHV